MNSCIKPRIINYDLLATGSSGKINILYAKFQKNLVNLDCTSLKNCFKWSLLFETICPYLSYIYYCQASLLFFLFKLRESYV